MLKVGVLIASFWGLGLHPTFSEKKYKKDIIILAIKVTFYYV